MNILHVIRSLDPAHGGPTFCATRLAAAQAGLGHTVSMLYFGGEPETDGVGAAIAALPGGSSIRLRPIVAQSEWVLGGARRATLDEAMSRVEYVHVHGVWERLLAAAAARARRAGVPYAATPHGMLDPWSLAQSAAKKRAALALYARRMLSGAAFIHALNADEERLMAPLGLRAPVRVIPNGVFLEELSPAPALDTFRLEHPELESDPYVLFLGRLHPKKGLDLLAAAFARVLRDAPRARLVVAGPDGGELAPFRTLAARLGMLGRTLISGPLYGARKLAAICGAACFCLPSRQEGFSVAVLEAAASGIPVVISDQCHFPEIAEGSAGRVVPLEINAIAAALTEVLTTPSLAAAMERAGAAMVRERYTWPRIAGAFLSAYEACRASGAEA